MKILVPDEKLIRRLKEKRGKGRNEWPVEASDATYELSVDYEVTKASNSELKETEKLLDNIKEKYPKKLEKCRYFLADKGYDSTELTEWLTTEGISPVIDIRNMWQGDETKQFKDTNIVYNYKGKVYYIIDSGKEIELLYKGYDKSRDSHTKIIILIFLLIFYS